MKKNLPYIIVGILLVIVLAVVIFAGNKPSTKDENDQQAAVTQAPTPSPTPHADIPKVDTKKAKNYYFVDLLVNGEKHINQAVTFSAKVNEINDSGFVVSEGFGSAVGSISVAFYDPADVAKIKGGDYVTITGTITERSLAYLFIKGATIVKNSDQVKTKISTEEKAYTKSLVAADEKKIDAAIAKSGSDAKAFLNQCKLYTSSEIDKAKMKKGDKIGLKLKVVQVNDGAWLNGNTYYQSITKASDGFWSGKTFAVYDYRKKAKAFKKDNIVTVLGTYEGIKTVKNQLTGATSKVPVIKMNYAVKMSE